MTDTSQENDGQSANETPNRSADTIFVKFGHKGEWLLMAVILIGFAFPLFGGIWGESDHTFFNILITVVLIVWPWIKGRLDNNTPQLAMVLHWTFASIATVLAIIFFGLLNRMPGIEELVFNIGYGEEFWLEFWTALLFVKWVQLAVGSFRERSQRMGTTDWNVTAGVTETSEQHFAGISSERRWLVTDLYKRSNVMRLRANAILVAIISLIVGGLASIYMAGDLVSGDAKRVTRLEQLTTSILGYEEKLQKADEELRKMAGQQQRLVVRVREVRAGISKLTGEPSPSLFRILLMSDDAPEILEKTKGRDVTDVAPTVDPDLEADYAEVLTSLTGERSVLVENYHSLNQQIRAKEDRRSGIRVALMTLEEQLSQNIQNYLVDSTPEPADLALLIASGVTRFGILLVVIFLVQILVGVYRYSLRLSAFYAGRADALVASVNRKSDLGGWGLEFLPGDIDFGRQPTTPAQYAIDAIKAYMKEEKEAEGPKKASAEPSV